MPKRHPEDDIKRVRDRITRIRDAIVEIDDLCSGTMLTRTKICGHPTCACATDQRKRHGPYHEWGHMRGGKLVHRMVSSDQAAALRRAIANYRRVRKLLQDWERETERLVDLEYPRRPR